MLSLIMYLLLAITGAACAYDGQLDPSFGNGQGFITYTVPGAQVGVSFICGVSIQTDGKIVVASQDSNSTQVYITRFNTNGSLDLSFGQLGTVTSLVYGNFFDGLLIQPDGKILVCASASNTLQALVQRFNTDGSVDNNFGSGNGVASFSSGGSSVWFNAMALQADGSIVATGGLNGNVLTVRFTQNGLFDTQFNSTPISQGNGLVVQADGKVVVATGQLNVSGSNNLIRYNSDGSLDSTFGSDGIASASSFSSLLLSVIVQTDGSLLAAGHNSNLGVVVISRFTPAGNLDLSYNGVGYNNTVPGTTIGNYAILALQPDGKAVFGNTDSSATYFQLVRYNTNGTVDNSFGSNGNGIVMVPQGVDGINAVALQTNGNIVAAGNDPSATLIQVSRYLNSPALAPTTMNAPRQNETISVNTPFTMTGQAQDPAFVYVLVDGLFTQPGAHTDPGNWSIPITINTFGNHTVQAVSLYQDGNVNISAPIVNITVGPVPPATFTGTVTKNEFLNKTEYVLQATLTPSVTAGVTAYAVYQNNILIALIPVTDPLAFVFCGKSVTSFNGIGVAAVINGIAGPQTPLVITA